MIVLMVQFVFIFRFSFSIPSVTCHKTNRSENSLPMLKNSLSNNYLVVQVES